MDEKRLSPSPSSVPFVPYVSSIESIYWAGEPSCDHNHGDELWDLTNVPGVQPTIIKDDMREFQLGDVINVRFFNEDSHWWGPKIVAHVLESLVCPRAGGGFVQTYVVCSKRQDGLLYYAHVIPYLGEVWPLDAPEPFIVEAEYKQRRDDLRTVYAQIPSMYTSTSKKSPPALVAVAYQAIVEDWKACPCPETASVTICAGPYKGSKILEDTVVPFNVATKDALSRTGFSDDDTSFSLPSLCSNSDSDSDEEFEKEFYSTLLLADGDVRDQSFDASENLSGDDHDHDQSGVLHFFPKTIKPVSSVIDLTSLVPVVPNTPNTDVTDPYDLPAQCDHGHSRNALIQLKKFWSLQHYKRSKRQRDLEAAQAAAAPYAGMEPSSDSPPLGYPIAIHIPSPSTTSTPLPVPAPTTRAPIYPRVGDLSKLRNPYAATVDRTFAHLPLNTIQKVLYLHDMTMRASDRCRARLSSNLSAAPLSFSRPSSPDSSDDESTLVDEDEDPRPWECDWFERWDVLLQKTKDPDVVVPASSSAPTGPVPICLSGSVSPSDAEDDFTQDAPVKSDYRASEKPRPKSIKFFFAEEEDADEEDAGVAPNNTTQARAEVAPSRPLERSARSPPPKYKFICEEGDVDDDSDSSLPVRELFCSPSVQFLARGGTILPIPI
ncbi:hypothetical protein B0H21DRAFT_895335 [Amylocystis lapponica]|nr:hypothetical protein B0H21DRAFT_895335 [Amylocystis lapponica]